MSEASSGVQTDASAQAPLAQPERPTRSLLRPFNRAGAPNILDLGFDAEPEAGAETLAPTQDQQDLASFPGERAPHVSFGFEGERWRLRNLVWVISQSETGQALLDQSYRAGYRVSFDTMTNTGERLLHSFNTLDKCLVLDGRGKPEELTVALALLLGFASAAIDGVSFDISMNPPAALLAHRMAAAHAHALQLQVCFELRTSKGLPASANKEAYWRLISKEQPRLSSGFAQAAVNALALSSGAAAAMAIREFYAHGGARASTDAEVINFYRALPPATYKDAKVLTGSFDPTAASLRLKFPGIAYACAHDPCLNLLDAQNTGADPAIAAAVAALHEQRKNAGVKDKDSWQIREVRL
jgi:hypothetical protein